jgi:hypothetical protein
VDVDHPDGDVPAVREGVLYAGRHEDERSRRSLELTIFHEEEERPFEDVERVVLGLVDVRCRPARCRAIVMSARLNRGVWALSARNSTFPMRWPPPGFTTTARRSFTVGDRTRVESRSDHGSLLHTGAGADV